VSFGFMKICGSLVKLAVLMPSPARDLWFSHR
jgi:hypothetical protein